jgi:NTP pyrophosphatase (non-canonical NTP hydrolase)
MPRVTKNTSVKYFQSFIYEIYSLPNDRQFSVPDMLSNIERFLLRGLKGIRKGNKEKTKSNLLISLSWFMSLMNQLHIDIEDEIWKRFPNLCSYCGTSPCSCKILKIQKRQKIKINNKFRPKTFVEFQEMFERIYPSTTRTLDHAGVHLAEEVGELSESLLSYRGSHKENDFAEVVLESADLLSCYIGVFNSMGLNIGKELSSIYKNNCHACHNTPCTCNFSSVIKYKS